MNSSPAPWTMSRVAALVGGVILTLIGLIITGGLALAGAIGFAVMYFWQRSRGRLYTHMAVWIGAFLGAAVTAAILVALLIYLAPGNAFGDVQHQMAAQQQQPVTLPKWERYLPGAENAPAIQAAEAPMLQSRTFTTVSLILSAIMGCGFFGAYAGTIAWGTIILLIYGFTGRRLGATTPINVMTDGPPGTLPAMPVS